MSRVFRTLLAVSPFILAASALAADWPQWQGIDRMAVSKETGLLQDWPKDGPPLKWEVTGLGEGFSTPAVAAGRILVMGYRDKSEQVFALAEDDGHELWACPISE